MVGVRYLAFSELNVEQWRQLVSLEAASHLSPWSLQQLRDCPQLGYQAQAAVDAHHQVVAYSVFMPNVDDWELLNITVEADQRGKGLGRQLLAHGLSQAQAAGIQGVFLEVRPSNTAAIALYTRLDFQLLGRRKGYYATSKPTVREDALIMRYACVQA